MSTAAPDIVAESPRRARRKRPQPQRQMTFSVGGVYTYTVQISTNELYDKLGRPACGLSDWDDRCIYLSGMMPEDRREETLYHEVVECWRFHGGEPADKENRTDWQAMIRKAFERDFAAGGGLQSLLAMPKTYTAPRPPRVSAGKMQEVVLSYIESVRELRALVSEVRELRESLDTLQLAVPVSRMAPMRIAGGSFDQQP